MQRTGRRPKIHVPNIIHHVMARGNNRDTLFYGPEYFEKFLTICEESLNKFDHEILSYCLMTNHLHMITRIQQRTLSEVMQNISFRYARWANGQLNRIGHLFQGRYKSISVSNEEYLVNLCRYIHLNPSEANMVSNLKAYPWSSHHDYLGIRKTNWISIYKMKNGIENVTGYGYQELISHSPKRDQWRSAMTLTQQGEIIIDDELLKNAGQQFKVKASVHLSEGQVIATVCDNLRIKPEKLYKGNRAHDISKKRALLIYYLKEYASLRMSKISLIFQRSQMTLTRQVRNIEKIYMRYFLSS